MKSHHFIIFRLAGLAVLAAFSLCPADVVAQQKQSADELVEQFKAEKVFWKQQEVARKLIAFQDVSVLPKLSDWLSHEDRHIRGNVALVFGALGDDRGLEVIRAILNDRSDRPEGQGQTFASSDGRYHVEQQIRADRYYAAHLLGDLKDRRAVPILISLLHDKEVNYIVPWALAEIGDSRADRPLIEMLADKSPSIRVLAIYALEKLNAKEALPDLRALLSDHERANFDKQEAVSEAATAAIAKLESKP
jgi:HEAT repeat protein